LGNSFSGKVFSERVKRTLRFLFSFKAMAEKVREALED
jgi:hypothetical protein